MPSIETYVGQTINGLEVLKLLPRNAQGDFKILAELPVRQAGIQYRSCMSGLAGVCPASFHYTADS